MPVPLVVLPHRPSAAPNTRNHLAPPILDTVLSPTFCFPQTLYNSMLENNCSEQSSRMSAMENSTKNAGEMLGKVSGWVVGGRVARRVQRQQECSRRQQQRSGRRKQAECGRQQRRMPLELAAACCHTQQLAAHSGVGCCWR